MPRKKPQQIIVLKATILLKPTDPDLPAIDDPELMTDPVVEELDGTEVCFDDPEGERDEVYFTVDLRDVEFVETRASVEA